MDAWILLYLALIGVKMDQSLQFKNPWVKPRIIIGTGNCSAVSGKYPILRYV
jgi:hypothetical protein